PAPAAARPAAIRPPPPSPAAVNAGAPATATEPAGGGGGGGGAPRGPRRGLPPQIRGLDVEWLAARQQDVVGRCLQVGAEVPAHDVPQQRTQVLLEGDHQRARSVGPERLEVRVRTTAAHDPAFERERELGLTLHRTA